MANLLHPPYAAVFCRRGGACHTRRVGVFHQPRRHRPAPPNLLRTHAACGIRRFPDCRYARMDGLSRSSETCCHRLGGTVARRNRHAAVFAANRFVFRRRLLAGVAAVLRLAGLARPQYRQFRPTDAACRVHRFSDGLCRRRRFEPVARASAFEHGGGHVRICPRQRPFGRGSP